MPGATDKSQFDLISFRKFVRLLDSSVAGERDAALNQALRLCAQNKPPLLFFEAAALAFGTNSSERDGFQNKIAHLETQIAAMEYDARQKEAQMVQLADKFVEAKRQIEQLIANGRKKAERGTHDFRALLRDLWMLPQIRLLCLSLILLGRVVVFWQFENARDESVFWTANTVFLPAAAVVFAKWTSLQYAEDGLLQLLVKWSLVVSGAVFSFYLLLNAWPWSSGSSMGLLLGSHFNNPIGSILILTLFSVLAISRLSAWVVEEVGAKVWESGPIQAVRGCF